jgi:hypothetical protein
MHIGTSTDPEIAVLHAAVQSRSANRRMGTPTQVDDATVGQLARAVEREGARLLFAADRDRMSSCAEVLGECDRLRFLIPNVHSEMMGELRWPGRDPLEEGMDVRTLEMDPGSLAAAELLARADVMGHLADWRGGQALGMRTRAAVQSSSGLAIITVPRADPTWYVRGGSAMERFWLVAERLGLAVQPVIPLFLYATDENDLIQLGGERHLDELFRLRERFATFWDLNEGETMVMVMRVFHAPPPSVRSLRLPLAHVLSRDLDGPEATEALDYHVM